MAQESEPGGREGTLTSKAARDSLNSALEREGARHQRELETKRKPLDREVVQHLVAPYVNLLAAEEAEWECWSAIASLYGPYPMYNIELW